MGRQRGKAPLNAIQNVVASYIRDGHSQEEAERTAQEWQRRMDERKAAIAQRNLAKGAPLC